MAWEKLPHLTSATSISRQRAGLAVTNSLITHQQRDGEKNVLELFQPECDDLTVLDILYEVF